MLECLIKEHGADVDKQHLKAAYECSKRNAIQYLAEGVRAAYKADQTPSAAFLYHAGYGMLLAAEDARISTVE
jgi:hypothetical protein